MDAKKPQEVYRDFKQSLAEGTEDWKQLIAEDVAITSPLIKLKGKSTFLKLYENYLETLVEYKVHRLVPKGNFVITQVSDTIKTQMGERVTVEMNEWYTIVDGKIKGLKIYYDASMLDPNERYYSLYQ
jgi:limonene-1,2-epoxide hydrolase